MLESIGKRTICFGEVERIQTLFKKEVMRYLTGIGSDAKLLKKLLSSLLIGKAEDFEAELSGFMCAMASFYSTALLSAGRSAILRGRFKSELALAKSLPVIRTVVLYEECAEDEARLKGAQGKNMQLKEAQS